MKNRIIIMASVAMLMWSCNQDEDQKPDFVLVEDAKETMQRMNEEFASDVAEMETTKGGEAMNDLINLMDGSTANLRSIKGSGLSSIESTISNAGTVFSILSTNEENLIVDNANNDFVFDQSKGVYNWDFSTNDFVKTDEISEYVIIHFPTEGSASNNAFFKLIEFSEVEIDGILEPEKVVAQLYVDDQLEVSIDLGINYSFLEIPESIDLDLFIAPFELKADFIMTLQSVSFSTSITRDETPMVSVDLIGAFSQNTGEFSSLNVSFSYGNVAMLGSLDVEGMNNAELGADINDFIDLKFYTNQYAIYDGSTLLGTAVFAPNDTQNDWVAYIEYTDGTRELLDEVFSGVFMELGDVSGGF